MILLTTSNRKETANHLQRPELKTVFARISFFFVNGSRSAQSGKALTAGRFEISKRDSLSGERFTQHTKV